MAIQQGNTHDWIKSSHSANGACVEIASPTPAAVAVRDSKTPSAATLRFSPEVWTGFLEGVTHESGSVADSPQG